MKQMQICIEVAEDERWLGGAIYLENLLSALSTLRETDQPCVTLSIQSNPDTPFVKRLRAMKIVRAANSGGGLLWRVLNRVDRDSGGRISRLIHCIHDSPGQKSTSVLWFPAFQRNLVPRRELYWIPDFQHFYLPQLFTAEELKRRNRQFDEIAAADGFLLLSSQTAFRDFVSRYPSAIVKPRVWSFCSSLPHLGQTDYQSVLLRYGLPERFLYIPNQFWKHKDHLTAFDALHRLRRRGISIPLVCTGYQGDYRDPSYFDTVKDYINDSELVSQIFLLGVIPREDQIQIFRCAAAVLQPSLFEGWSTVIEDAKALGRPIIASDLEVHCEQLFGVDGATFFSASNSADLAERLAQLWPQLPPGPDFVTEQLASRRTEARRKVAAHEFMAIAREALGGCIRYEQH
ncbi:MAG TPA: glycosyltransferase [Methylomirabilota bacterium]|nr:glycosyltransferase [Methylomirabilota bacterium]